MNLADFFKEHKKVALAFSGGVDSAYLLYAATLLSVDVVAYYIKSSFQPDFEYQDALRLARELNANLKDIEVDILSRSDVISNPANRCYICKNLIFNAIIDAAYSDGYTEIIDGTNASDMVSDRPGMQALRELGVYSPLRLCGITKDEVRKLSKDAGLFTWNKPSYACLATRIKTGELITKEILEKIEKAEDYLHSLGLLNIRVRYSNNVVRLEIDKDKIDIYEENKTNIKTYLLGLFSEIDNNIVYR